MKKNLPFGFIFIFSFILLFTMGVSPLNSFSQTAAADTNHVKILMDSCRTLGELQCGTDLLKLIQQKLSEVRNGEEKAFYEKAEITTLRNIGSVHIGLSHLSNAMEYYEMSRKKAQEIGDKFGIAAALLNIGNIYLFDSNYPGALKYLEKSLKIFQEIKNTKGIGICFSSIGSIYKEQSDYPKALEYFQTSLTIQQERADISTMMTCIINIGDVYEKLSKFSEASRYFETALKYAKSINDARGILNSLSGIGNILYSTGKYKEAEKTYNEVLKLVQKRDDIFIRSETYSSLKDVFEKQGRHKEALSMFDKYIVLRDSIFNQEKSRDVVRRDAKYEFEKKEAEIKIEQDKKDIEAAGEKRRQQIIIRLVAGGLFLMLLFAVFIFRSLQVTRKQNKFIEEQKGEANKQRELANSRRIIAEEQTRVIEIKKAEVERSKKIIEQHNKDITDSIQYAMRIQNAMLPHRSDIREAFPQSFVLFKPKDIVSGDFYFFQTAPQPPEGGHKAGAVQGTPSGGVFIAVADCTGHGVPGAFMSMLGTEKLHDAAQQTTNPGEILQLLNKGIKQSLHQSEEFATRDGMDIALCVYNQEMNLLEFAGANRPVWIIKKENNNEIFEIKPTKVAIGGLTADDQEFTVHKTELKKGDAIYIFSDGYADQFSQDNKKMMTKRFKETLISIQDKSMNEQQEFLDSFMDNWRGTVEQVDDVCIIGIRI